MSYKLNLPYSLEVIFSKSYVLILNLVCPLVLFYKIFDMSFKYFKHKHIKKSLKQIG